jgi:hypothetical protein
MPKFQSTINTKRIIEVTEDRAIILRTKVQTGWQEFFEEKVEVAPPAPKKKAPVKKRVVKKRA